eukprot:11228309-Lingulodinium_polyedra.AAC.4
MKYISQPATRQPLFSHSHLPSSKQNTRQSEIPCNPPNVCSVAQQRRDPWQLHSAVGAEDGQTGEGYDNCKLHSADIAQGLDPRALAPLGHSVDALEATGNADQLVPAASPREPSRSSEAVHARQQWSLSRTAEPAVPQCAEDAPDTSLFPRVGSPEWPAAHCAYAAAWLRQ